MATLTSLEHTREHVKQRTAARLFVLKLRLIFFRLQKNLLVIVFISTIFLHRTCYCKIYTKKVSKLLGLYAKNRTMKCLLRPSKSFEKEKRGFFDYCSDECVSIAQWKDNKVVYVGSNFCNIEPTKMVKRYNQRERKRINCNQPFCFYVYNQGMGGVDLLDRFISQYRPTIQEKKWYWPLFLNWVQMITVTAWRLHVAVQISTRLDLLDFIQSVVAGLLKNSRRPASSGPSDRRIMNNSFGQHHPVNAENQGRYAKCKKNTANKCQECGVRLHTMCLLNYHK